MILLALLLGFVLGILFILSVQYFTLSWIFKLSPKAKPPRPPPFTAPSLPPELSQKASGPFREETCQWVNFCGAFLFQELRESNLVKKAIITKLNEEFKEVSSVLCNPGQDGLTLRFCEPNRLLYFSTSATVLEVVWLNRTTFEKWPGFTGPTEDHF